MKFRSKQNIYIHFSQSILNSGYKKKVLKTEEIFKSEDEILIFLNGEVKLTYYTHSGKEKVLSYFDPDDCNFFLFEFKKLITNITLIAVKDSSFLVLDKKKLSLKEEVYLKNYLLDLSYSMLEDLFIKNSFSSKVFLIHYLQKYSLNGNLFIKNISKFSEIFFISRVQLYNVLNSLIKQKILKKKDKHKYQINQEILKKEIIKNL